MCTPEEIKTAPEGQTVESYIQVKLYAVNELLDLFNYHFSVADTEFLSKEVNTDIAEVFGALTKLHIDLVEVKKGL